MKRQWGATAVRFYLCHFFYILLKSFFVFSVLIVTPLETEITCCVKKKKKKKILCLLATHCRTHRPVTSFWCCVWSEVKLSRRRGQQNIAFQLVVDSSAIRLSGAIVRHPELTYQNHERKHPKPTVKRTNTQHLIHATHNYPHFIQMPVSARRNRGRRDAEQMASVFLPLNGQRSENCFYLSVWSYCITKFANTSVACCAFPSQKIHSVGSGESRSVPHMTDLLTRVSTWGKPPLGPNQFRGSDPLDIRVDPQTWNNTLLASQRMSQPFDLHEGGSPPSSQGRAISATCVFGEEKKKRLHN